MMGSVILAAGGGSPDANLLIPFLVSLASVTGVGGLMLAVAKLRPEKTSAAIAQAQGAADAMQEALVALERERDYWIKRHGDCHERANGLAAQVQALRRELRELQNQKT